MIGAIETEYNGYRFRSRLEARWAVFFDTASIVYEYEPQGFELSSGDRYLPDFYLPEFDYYVEVKPPRDGIGYELLKITLAVEDGLINNLIVLSNIPDFTNEKVIFWYPAIHRSYRYKRKYSCDRVTFLEYGKKIYIIDDFTEGIKQQTDILFYHEKNNSLHDELVKKEILPTFIEKNEECEEYENLTVNNCFEKGIILKALSNARQARFEHGETPKNY